LFTGIVANNVEDIALRDQARLQSDVTAVTVAPSISFSSKHLIGDVQVLQWMAITSNALSTQ